MSLVKTNQLTNRDNTENLQVEVLEGLKINSGKTLSVLGPLHDADGEAGDSGQVLSSTATGINWTSPADLNTTYNISTINGASNTTKGLRLTAGGNAGAGVTDDIFFAGGTSVNITRDDTSDTLTFGLVQDISTTSNVTFNDITSTGKLVVNSIKETDSDTAGCIKWNPDEVRWQFSNNGSTYYNFILPTETVYDVASQYGASGDGNSYLVKTSGVGLNSGTVVIDSNSYLQVVLDTVDDIQYFNTLQQVKIFGASTTPAINLPDAPNIAQITITPSFVANEFNDVNIDKKYYVYAFASYNLLTGDVSEYVVIPDTKIVQNLSPANLSESNYNTINITRNSTTEGILIYRGIFDSLINAENSISGIGGNQSAFKLFAVLGQKEFSNPSTGVISTLTTDYIDYGEYDVPSWTSKNADGTYKTNDIVHFNINPPVNKKRGWATGDVKSVDGNSNSFVIDIQGLEIDSTYPVYVYHDDTVALQTAINELSTDGTDFLIIPGGTYLIDQLKIPDGFALRGLDDATVLKKQYWNTTKINDTPMSGLRNSMFVPAGYDSTAVQTNWTTKNFVLRDIVIDGNAQFQLLYDRSFLGIESNNSALGFPNSEFLKLKDIKIRNTSGPALFAEGSKDLAISGTNISNGLETERYSTLCISASDSENVNITSTFFGNFPGALDLTTSNVLSMNGSVVKNCGSGIQIYGSVNVLVRDNLILGPAGEYIPVPDLYDTDYDGVNLSIEYDVNQETPIYQYQADGSVKDLTNTIINFDVHIATVSNNIETVDLSQKVNNVAFQRYIDPNVNATVGQIQFNLSQDNSKNVFPPNSSITNNQYYVYRILGIDYYVPTYNNVPIGSDLDPVFGGGETVDSNAYYQVDVLDNVAFGQITQGDYIKLVAHNFTPTGDVNLWYVFGKFNEGGQNKLKLQPKFEQSNGDVIPATGFTGVGGGTQIGGGYYELRNKYVIAKGVISRAY